MKYLNFTEAYAIYELPFAKGLQYQACIVSMEGGDFFYIVSEDELEESMDKFNAIVLDESFGE
jgi:hypothetical protein